MRIFNRAHVPWAIFVVVATLVAVWLYVGNFHPGRLPSNLQLPREWVQKPSEHRSVGGTPLGLIFGSIALAIFIFAALLGVRKKLVLWRIGTVQRWLRAHIWLTLLTIPLVILHSGFRLGGPMTTLLIVLYVIVMVSGIYGLALQHQIPRIMMERLPAESVYEQIPHIRGQLYAAAQKMRDSLKPAPLAPAAKTDAGAPAPSAAKAVTSGSTPMSSTAAELSTPTARAKTAVGSSIIAESVEVPSSPKASANPAGQSPEPKPGSPSSASPHPPPNESKPPETMGTPTARVPEGEPVPPGTERVTGVAPAEVVPRSVTAPTPIVASSAAPAEKHAPETIAQPKPAAVAVSAKPVATAKATDVDSEAALLDFLDRQILPYLAAKRGERLRLGNARFSEDTFRFVTLRVTEGYRGRVEEIQGWCDERRMLDLQTKLQHWLHGWVFIHAPISFLLLMLTMWHAFVTLFYY
jgi:hypothetical protein